MLVCYCWVCWLMFLSSNQKASLLLGPHKMTVYTEVYADSISFGAWFSHLVIEKPEHHDKTAKP